MLGIIGNRLRSRVGAWKLISVALFSFCYLSSQAIAQAVFPDSKSLDVLTQRNDNNRTGASHWPGVNQRTVSRFTKIGELLVDGVVTAQPLFVRSAMINGVRQPALIVATANNDVYVFPAFGGNPPPYSPVHLDAPLVAADNSTVACPLAPNAAWWDPRAKPSSAKDGLTGIEATPVIDLANNQVLIGYKTADFQQHLAALDLNSGNIRSVLVPPPYPDWPRLHRNRASLLLADGVVYLAFSSLCEGQQELMHGSIAAFDAKALKPVGTFQVTDGNTDGGGIWQGSTGPAADSAGNLYFATGNRRLPPPCLSHVIDGSPADNPTLSNSVIRLGTSKITGQGGFSLAMSVQDSFTPYRKVLDDCADLDLASGGILLIPGTKYLVSAGKEGIVYVLDRDHLGGFDTAGGAWSYARAASAFQSSNHSDVPDDPSHDHVQQKFQVGRSHYEDDFPVRALAHWPHIHGTPVFASFSANQAFMFVWPEKDAIKRFHWLGDHFDPEPTQGSHFAPAYFSEHWNGMPGGMLSVNIDPEGPGLGVVFASVKNCGEDGYPACDTSQDFGLVLAYDPITMNEIWSNRGESISLQNNNGGYFFSKFVPPTVAVGHLYVATGSGRVLIYGPDSSIWHYTRKPCDRNGSCNGWEQFDNNEIAASITASNGGLYELHKNGKIWKSAKKTCIDTITCPGWELLDNSPGAQSIVADGAEIYQIHGDGSIWHYITPGAPPCAINASVCPGWQMLDKNPQTSAIAASSGRLYQMWKDGHIWQYTGTACDAVHSNCFGWKLIDSSPGARSIVADGSEIYQIHGDGSIWHYVTPGAAACDIHASVCPGWEVLDKNPRTVAIAAGGGQLYQLHGPE